MIDWPANWTVKSSRKTPNGHVITRVKIKGYRGKVEISPPQDKPKHKLGRIWHATIGRDVIHGKTLRQLKRRVREHRQMSKEDKISEAFAALNAIEQVGTKRKPKMEIMQAHAKNEVFRDTFSLAYDWMHTFGITSKAINGSIRKGSQQNNLFGKTSDTTFAKRWKRFRSLMERFEERELTGGAATEAWKKFIKGVPLNEAMWYTRVLNRDLRIGVARGTITKIWPDLLPIFPCMLAESYDPEKPIVWPNDADPDEVAEYPWYIWPLYLEPKLDGMRVMVIIADGKGTCRSRTGRDIPNLQHIADRLAKVCKNGVFDGEAMWRGKIPSVKKRESWGLGKEIKDGVWNVTMSLITTQEENHTEKSWAALQDNVVLYAFDHIPLKDWMAGECAIPLNKRKVKLAKYAVKLGKKSILELVTAQTVHSMAEAMVAYDKHLTEGFEGSMLKYPDAPYYGDRCDYWMKIKPTDTIDAEILKVLRGDEGKKHHKWMGRLKVRLPNGEICRIGGGFSDKQREELWKRRKEIVGMYAEFKVQKEETSVATARFPRFVTLREDL